MVAPDPAFGAAAAAAPATAPQWWQNLEPGVSGCPQEVHGAPLSGAPHSVQNLPVPGAEQRGQTVVFGCD
jgi:hypothetical protein